MLKDLFGTEKPIIGVVHLLSLPGSAGWDGQMEPICRRAEQEAMALATGGAHGIIIENFFDAPFTKHRLDAVTISAFTIVVQRVMALCDLPIGINCLRNDGLSAMAIAATTGARFIRVNVLAHAMVTDQGIIEGIAHELLLYRKNLGADKSIKIFADILVKHAAPIGLPLSALQLQSYSGLQSALGAGPASLPAFGSGSLAGSGSGSLPGSGSGSLAGSGSGSFPGSGSGSLAGSGSSSLSGSGSYFLPGFGSDSGSSPLPGFGPDSFGLSGSHNDIVRIAKETKERALADALIISGFSTGEPPAIEDLKAVRKALPDCPIIAGSGVDKNNIATICDIADGVIVASSLKQQGIIENPIDVERVRSLLTRRSGIMG